MTGKVFRIERSNPAESVDVPFKSPRGFKLADPNIGEDRHHSKYAVFAATLEEAAEKVEAGFSLWMKRPGKRETLISPLSLRVVRA